MATMDVEKQQEQDPLHSVTTPRTADGSRIQVTDAQAPGRCFHPTVATIEIEGKKYLWNARAHRKLRYPTSKDRRDHPEKARHRIHLLSFEPHIVSWYICWTGFVANSLWVVNGLYATWPEAASSGEVAELTIYGTGVAGAFLFIIGGYLLYVEAINQNYSKVILPTTEATTRHVSHPSPSNIYGQGQHPLLNLSDQVEEEHLAQMGYPVVQDVPTKLFVTEPLCHRIAQQRAAESEQDNGSPTFTLQGRKLDILIGRHAIRTTVDSIYIRKEKGVSVDDDDKVPNESKEKKKEKSAYIWWSWSPDFRHISILNALIYFIATVLFFIPATVWLPMDRHGNASVASTVFWVQVMQIIPCIGFIYTGHASMAEAAGSLWKLDFNNVGWWICLLNTVGSYGFMAYAILAIPSITDPDNHVGLTKWGADLGTFWGSCAFWLAGVLQWIEFSSQHPISVDFS